MAKINLRDYYPFYNSDLFLEVSDEVAAALDEDKRREQSYQRRLRYHNAQYSLGVRGRLRFGASYSIDRAHSIS